MKLDSTGGCHHRYIGHAQTVGISKTLFMGLCLFFHCLVYASEEPVVLLHKASHSRNTDVISVVFRQDTAQLTVNTSSYQKKGQPIRLGRFESAITPELESFRKKIMEIHSYMQNTVPLSSFIPIDERFYRPDPHAPVIYVNKEKMRKGYFGFDDLEGLVYKIWENDWQCISCAFYARNENFIQRTLYKPAVEENPSTKLPLQWTITERYFSQTQLDCFAHGKEKIECVDPEFGIFEI